MTLPPTNSVTGVIRAWLRNERRLGVRHLPVAATALSPEQPQRPTARRVPPQPPVPRDTAQPTQLIAAQPARQFTDSPALPPIETRKLPRAEAQAALDALNETFVRGCTLCRLHEKRTQTVFGVGNPKADLVFVGEGPGADEDRQGEPFVGKAGQLLTRMIAAMTLTRDQVYICNVVKCRPPGNRTPLADEMETCAPYLLRQLAIIRPKIIVSLGRPASQTLLATDVPISRLRGTMHEFPPPALRLPGVPECKLMPTFHPAYLLRSPNEKGKAWSDLQDVMRFLEIPVPARGT